MPRIKDAAWPSCDPRWEQQAKLLFPLLERHQPIKATAIHRIARDKLGWKSSFTINVMAWMSIHKWAGWDSFGWHVLKMTPIRYEVKPKPIKEPQPKPFKTRIGRRCSICKSTGHDRRKCPERYGKSDRVGDANIRSDTG